MKVTAIIAAGGAGRRMGAGENKVFMKIAGREMLTHTVSVFNSCAAVTDIIIVVGAEDITRTAALTADFDKVIDVIAGGETRQQSVMNGLLRAERGIALIHDSARALVTEDIILRVIHDCEKYGAAAAGVKCKDTLKSAENGFISGTIDRESTYLIQTPQAFGRDEILDMHKRALREGFTATDDCMIAERYGVKIRITEGSYENIKLTTPEDIITAEKILGKRGEV